MRLGMLLILYQGMYEGYGYSTCTVLVPYLLLQHGTAVACADQSLGGALSLDKIVPIPWTFLLDSLIFSPSEREERCSLV